MTSDEALRIARDPSRIHTLDLATLAGVLALCASRNDGQCHIPTLAALISARAAADAAQTGAKATIKAGHIAGGYGLAGVCLGFFLAWTFRDHR